MLALAFSADLVLIPCKMSLSMIFLTTMAHTISQVLGPEAQVLWPKVTALKLNHADCNRKSINQPKKKFA